MTPLDLTFELERVIEDVTLRVPELNHIDPLKLLVCIAFGRTGGGGSYAKIHPLRFPGGTRSMTTRRGRKDYLCTMPTINHRGQEMLYVVYFLVPRFMELSLREKLVTIFHELYHVSPECDGDIRRFPGRNYAHGSSTKSYNMLMRQLVDRYLEILPDQSILHFLEGDMGTLRRRHPKIVARRLPAPRISVAPAK
ncbi:putative metallopeptidase [Geomesophilobacter sediminis]|uniref:Putative phage metallopeptidase domain-containing protein n=1 Tax=Geomesophilobacter sediminis TaxID=2798584 RepID=A0A8J7JLU7_9BACT|nr:putative metallopeptidase [Geomesophilobacter sediminis]MBJ6725400.1 hypothetical protein [Geomesophilobacter sediminis]